MNRLLAGTLSGCVATAPMTLVMQILHRWPSPEPDALPPQQITEEIAETVGMKKLLDDSSLSAAVLASHFGFGGAAGGLYALLFSKLPLPVALKGAVWGLIVWVTAYLGWLPATNVLSSATDHPTRRNVLMIVAHLVWGMSTALLCDKLTDDANS